MALWLIFSLAFRFGPESRFSAFGNRLESIKRQITEATQDGDRAARDAVLAEFSQNYHVEFFIFDRDARQIAGRAVDLPPEVRADLLKLPVPERNRKERLPPPERNQSIVVRAGEPPLYWSIASVLMFESGAREPTRGFIVVASDSWTGHGLFFNPTPWLILFVVIVSISTALWLPFVRRITRSIAQMTSAAEQIAAEKFDVRVDEKRGDELGRMGAAVNHLAARLQNFIGGQKRFLGDVSHELNSPLARMQFALSILETKIDETDQTYIQDVREEVELMTKLVAELLAYSKAGITGAHVTLETLLLRPLIVAVVTRETINHNAQIEIEIDDDATVHANHELLSRALSNLVRNAVRYAADYGTIRVTAQTSGAQTKITVSDKGRGVPESELARIFDPFHRLESDRDRATGGTGLGLAIVKSCVEACHGEVTAKNLQPNGFAVTIILH